MSSVFSCLLSTLFFWDRVLQWNNVFSIRLNWPAHEPQGSACLTSQCHSRGHIPPSFPCGYWGDLKSSYLCANRYQRSHLPSPGLHSPKPSKFCKRKHAYVKGAEVPALASLLANVRDDSEAHGTVCKLYWCLTHRTHKRHAPSVWSKRLYCCIL